MQNKNKGQWSAAITTEPMLGQAYNAACRATINMTDGIQKAPLVDSPGFEWRWVLFCQQSKAALSSASGRTVSRSARCHSINRGVA